MTMTRDWQQIKQLDVDGLRREIFNVMRDAALAIHAGDGDRSSVLETVPRLAELLEERQDLDDLREPFSSLARATGLWNYIDKDAADTPDLLLADAVTIPELDGITLHREQVEALNVLLSGRNLILSAPTSFGKSLIIDALLLSNRYSRIAIVLPTIALLDEFRRRLHKRLGERFQIIQHASEKASSPRVIFLGTQERLVHRPDIGKLDLTVVDEFYKLDPNRHDERSITLNAATYKLLSRSTQFFFLGPNIDSVRMSHEGKWQFQFLRTRFSTVAVDTQDLTAVLNKRERLLSELQSRENWPSLVFMSSPDKANRLAEEAAEMMALSDKGNEFADWLDENVGSKSSLARAARSGIALHHGRIQRAIASQMIREFNSEILPVLFCTSTLIEGVNTAAKTVLIYDKRINNSAYDFFTYSNIKGRAGRLGQHHVGRVVLFNAPPDTTETEVAPTLFGDEADAPDEFVVHLEPQTDSKIADARVSTLRAELGLSLEDLRLVTSIGIENALALKARVAAALDGGKTIAWSGFPDFKQIRDLLDIVTPIENNFGFYNTKQLAFNITKLRSADRLTTYLREYNNWYKGKSEAYDNVFKFLRACEFGLPQYLSVVESFVKQHAPETDYGLLIQGLNTWFRSSVLKELDEEGIPIQIAERFYDESDTRDTLRTKLATSFRNNDARLSPFEKRWIAAALNLV